MSDEFEGKRVFIGTLELEYLVVAANDAEAKGLCHQAMKDDFFSGDDFRINPFVSYTPAQYEDDDLVHSNTKTALTVAEALKLPGGYMNENDPNAIAVRERNTALHERAKARFEELKANPVPDDNQD